MAKRRNSNQKRNTNAPVNKPAHVILDSEELLAASFGIGVTFVSVNSIGREVKMAALYIGKDISVTTETVLRFVSEKAAYIQVLLSEYGKTWWVEKINR